MLTAAGNVYEFSQVRNNSLQERINYYYQHYFKKTLLPVPYKS